MCHSGGGSTLNRKTIKPGAHPGENKFLELLACLHHFPQDSHSCSGLSEPAGLKGDSSAPTSRKVNTNISAAVGQLHRDAFGLEFVLHNFGSGSVAADDGGLG